MRTVFRSHSMFVILLLALVVVVSCGSDGPVTPEPPTPTDVDGVVVKGPVTGAQVEIRALGGDGGPGDLVIGPVTTDVDGAWTVTIPAEESGTHFLVVATGGSYTDEVTQAQVDVPAGSELIGFLDRDHPTSVAVTPYTHLLYLQTREIVVDVGAATAWERAVEKAAALNSFGFNPTTTLPSWEATASGTEKAYAALLGALGGMPQLASEYTTVASAPPFFLVMGVVEDLIDGSLDGRGIGAQPVDIPMDLAGTSTEPLPLVSAEGAGLLNDWARGYADETPGLEDADLTEDMVIGVPTGEPDDFDCSDLAALRSAAHASLENTLFATLNGPDPEVPDDLDFSECRNLYLAVLECDATDLDAHFALAVLDLTAMSLDPAVNDAFDEWDAYLDEMIPFEVTDAEDKLSVPTGLSPRGAMELPFDTIHRSLAPWLNLQKAVAPPQLADVQDIFRNSVLPRVLTGIGHIDEVLDDPAFTFTVSPRMQGDLLEEYRTADETDFLALRAGLSALEAGLRIAVSYHVNLTEYTGEVLRLGLVQGTGDLLTLQTDGETQMQQAGIALTGAADDLDAAIDALIAETDDQTDDLIKIGPNDLDQADLLDFQATELQMIIDSLAGPASHSYDWDFDSGTPDAAMIIDLYAFFDDPVADFKGLLPPYTTALDTVPYNENWHWDWDYESVAATVPDNDYYSFGCTVRYEDFQIVEDDCTVPAWIQDSFDTIVADEAAAFLDLDDWAGYGYVNIYYDGRPGPGERLLNLEIQTQYSTMEAMVEIVTVTLAANTFTEWLSQWPDPTLGGLFPDVTTAAEVAEAFGMEERNWEKEFSLDWADEGFGSRSGPTEPAGP